MMKESEKNFLLVTVSCLVAFAVLEISLRVYYGNQPVFLFPQVSHIATAYGYKPTPNQTKSYTLDKLVVTNSYGFRDYEWKMPKPPDKIRIMVVGDSLTFGNAAPYEAIFSRVLDRKLRKLHARIEVINAATQGWSTFDELDFLKLEGLGYQPDVVIIGFYPNDFVSRPKNYQASLSEEGRWESRPQWLRWLPYRYIFLLKRSALVTYMRDRAETLFQAEKDIVNKLLFNEIDLNKDQNVIDTLGYILELKQACGQKNAKLLLALIPPVNAFWLPRGQPRYNDLLRSFCQAQDIAFVDLAEGFWKVKNPTALYYYPWDLHMTPKGHQLVAEQLAQPVMALLQPPK
jgi:lysophospholipase L1-like esterase